MACRDHDAAVEIVHPGDVGNTGRGSDVQQVGVCAGCGQASDQTVLEHIGTAAGVLADDDAGRLIVAVALAQCIIISAKEAAYLVGMVGSQINTSFTTEAISPKILSHYRYFSSSKE